MNHLQVIQHDGIEVVDSREVAEMVGKQHKELLRDIRNYAEVLSAPIERNFALNDFFIESTYKDSIGRTLPCYLITKKGCDMVANKMTGEKGVLFTAAYVTAFEKMQHKLKTPLTPAEQLLAQAQLMVEQEQRIQALETGQTEMRTAMHSAFSELAVPTAPRDHWQDAMCKKIRQLCVEHQLNFQTFTGQLYKELEETAHVNLETRRKRLRERMKRGGAKSAECQAVSKLAIVSQDPKLREIFSALVQRRAAMLVSARVSAM
nr:MAG TPA: regulatory protein [Caudoviricetes sp.]